LPEIAYPIPKLWFERLGERFRLPLWGTAFLFGLGPFIILGAVSSSLPGGAFVAPVGASSSDVFYNILLNVLLVSSISLLTFYTGRYLRREIIGLLDYATSLQSRFTSGSPKLRLNNLSSVPRTMISFAILGSFTFPLFILGGTGTYFENAAGEIPYVWLIFIMASFFWIFGYSMYAIYRMGKLPLILRPYSQDRTLGLRPFAKASLNSTLIYATAATAMVVPVALSGALPLKLALLFLALYPVGFLLFLLPLRSLHAKLMEAKAEALAKVTPRYERLVEAVSAGGKVNDEVANEMAVVITIRNDLQQIRTWPFDAGIIVRLLAIVISVVAILLSALIRDFLHI
jgi:hypothetical protein